MINMGEILVVVLVALLVIKPENLPETAFTLGRGLKWLRKMTSKIKQEFEEPLEKLTHEKSLDESSHE